MKLTLDWNCVIEVEENGGQASHVLELIRLHQDGALEVALLAASASENARSKRFPGNARIFKDRIFRLGWQDLPLVPMPGVTGLSYWDFCYNVGDDEPFERDRDALWHVIAPTVPRPPSDHLPEGAELDDDMIQSEALAKWRNTWCDVISAYSHIRAGRDVFITNNTRDFQRNSEKLFLLGMKQICTPEQALSLIAKMQ